MNALQELRMWEFLGEILATLQAQLAVQEKTLKLAQKTLKVSEQSLDTLVRIEKLLTPPPRPASMTVDYARRLTAPNNLRVTYQTTLASKN
jgi:hypothetical protein